MKADVGKRYKHYKNKQEYVVLAIARHSETLEELVIYEAQCDSIEYGKNCVWARPRAMFEEEVTYDGRSVPRFECVDFSDRKKLE